MNQIQFDFFIETKKKVSVLLIDGYKMKKKLLKYELFAKVEIKI